MTSFVHIEHPASHAGVGRVEAAVQSARKLRPGSRGAGVVTAVLLAGVLAAAIVLADHWFDPRDANHLLAGWVVLWVTAFGVGGFYAPTIRKLAIGLRRALQARAQRSALARSDERMWQAACSDPRVMADLQSAISRHEGAASALPK